MRVHAYIALYIYLTIVIMDCSADTDDYFYTIPATVYSKHETTISSEQKGQLLSIMGIGKSFKKGDLLFEIDSTENKSQLRILREQHKNLSEKLSLQNELVHLYESYRDKKMIPELVKAEQLVSYYDTKNSIYDLESNIVEHQQVISKKLVGAPFDGIVVNQFASQYESVKAGDRLIKILNPKRLFLLANVPAAITSQIQDPSNCFSIKESHDSLSMDYISPKIDTKTNTVEISLQLKSRDFVLGEQIQLRVCRTPVSEIKDD